MSLSSMYLTITLYTARGNSSIYRGSQR